MSTQSFSVTSDSETRTRVRTITGYDDTVDEIPQATLSNLLDAAKAKVYSDADTTAWYSDHHMGQVLVYTLCIQSKLRVENVSTKSWSLGNESITALTADADVEGQLNEWNDEINENLGDSDETESGGSGVAQLTVAYDW